MGMAAIAGDTSGIGARVHAAALGEGACQVRLCPTGPQEHRALLAHGTGWMNPYQGDRYFEYGVLDRV